MEHLILYLIVGGLLMRVGATMERRLPWGHSNARLFLIGLLWLPMLLYLAIVGTAKEED